MYKVTRTIGDVKKTFFEKIFFSIGKCTPLNGFRTHIEFRRTDNPDPPIGGPQKRHTDRHTDKPTAYQSFLY